jgi:hypothetical protein
MAPRPRRPQRSVEKAKSHSAATPTPGAHTHAVALFIAYPHNSAVVRSPRRFRRQLWGRRWSFRSPTLFAHHNSLADFGPCHACAIEVRSVHGGRTDGVHFEGQSNTAKELPNSASLGLNVHEDFCV